LGEKRGGGVVKIQRNKFWETNRRPGAGIEIGGEEVSNGYPQNQNKKTKE